MRILHVIIVYPPAKGKGGPMRSVKNLATAQVARGDDVTVYTTDMRGESERFGEDRLRETIDGVKIRRFRNISHHLAWNNLPAPPGMARALSSSIEGFDVAHLHACRTFDGVLVHHYATKHEVPYVIEPRGSVPRLSGSRRKYVFDLLFGRKMFADADRVVAASRVESAEYSDVFPSVQSDRVAHVPNGIDLSRYSRTPAESTVVQSEIRTEEPVILFLSRLHDRKGADLLIRAFAELGEPGTLLIAGPDDGSLPMLRALVDEIGLSSVRFPGPLYGDEKLAVYDLADVFVLPSKDRYESFGNVVIEAMARGTAVIATDRCGVVEWLDDDAVSVVQPTVAHIAASIQDVLANESRRRMLEQRGQETVKSLSWARVCDEMAEIYETIR